jgi:hypothetical protein
MLVCHSCHRHIRASEPDCPFCGERVRSTHGRLPLLASAFVGLIGLVGCAEPPTSTDAVDSSNSVSASETDSASDSTSTGTDEAISTNDDFDTGLSFYAGPTDVGVISECDPFAQDCPEGEKCVPYSSTGGNWDANKCVPVTGEGAPGDACTWGGIVEATDDCGADSICWDVMDVEGTLIGVCRAFCTGSADAPVCDPGSSCVIANDGSVTICLPHCDPLVQDCTEGLACYWTGTDFFCIFTTQDIPTGEPCRYINDCAAGNVCVEAASLPSCAGAACCASFCDLAAPICAAMGTQCVAHFEQGMAPVGYENLGVCLLAP